jgi:mRNA interferase RelE/StbE
MAKLIVLPPAAKYFKKIKDKNLKLMYQQAIDSILLDHTVGVLKTGDLNGVFCYDIYYNG